ncbi:MAG: phosphopantetheine-binding protein [Rikenellaceae bacterium]|nr:phosphopantetheine-binding protein [Rikenellaceae bacterium]
MQEIENKIREFIQENLLVFEVETEIKNTDNIFEMGLVNSLFAMKLLTYIEREFCFIIDNDDLDLKNFNCIENICKLIKSRIEALQL